MARCVRCGTAWLARDVTGDAYGRERFALRPLVGRQPLIIEGEVARPSARHGTTLARPAAAQPPPGKRRPPPARYRLAAFGAGIGLVVLLGLAVPIAAAIPGIAGLFSADAGIVLDRIRSNSMKLGGSDALMVEGELTNTTGHGMPVPAIRISLHRDGGGEAYSWLVEPSALELAAGASIGFRSALANPVPDAASVVVSLAPREQRIGMR